MNYHVARNGQTYGPYSEETLRKYLAEGSIQPGDMGRTDAMPEWTPVGQLLGVPSALPSPSGFAPPPPAQSNVFGNSSSPPNLHWALVLVIAVVTSGIFYTVWAIVQSMWIKTIDPASRATRDLLIGILLPLVAGIIAVFTLATGAGIWVATGNSASVGVGSVVAGGMVFLLIALCGIFFHLRAVFSMKASLERHYNTVEPIHLRLSGIMTLFFNVLYFQYHLTRIAEWKSTGVLRP